MDKLINKLKVFLKRILFFPSEQEIRFSQTKELPLSRSLRISSSNFEFEVSGLSDCGNAQELNGDNYLIHGGSKARRGCLLLAVAMGLGGQELGELASDMAVRTLRRTMSDLLGRQYDKTDMSQWLAKAVYQANQQIIERACLMKKECKMGSTLVAALIHGQEVYLSNVGDSRAYLLRDNQLIKITEDHSLVNLLVKQGLISSDEVYAHPRRTEIMKFLGQRVGVNSDLFHLQLSPGDTLLLCSRGLWGALRDHEIGEILNTFTTSYEACHSLIEGAKLKGADENITCVIARLQ